MPIVRRRVLDAVGRNERQSFTFIGLNAPARLCRVKNRRLTPQPCGQIPFKKGSKKAVYIF